MAESIKGLSVKIGADTSDFIKGLKKVDKEINLTNKQANELQKGLQLEFDEGRFVEAQRLVRQSLEQTEEKAKAIREQLKYLENTGNVNTDGYKKLQTELYKAENNAVMLKQKLEDINNIKTTSFVDKIKGMASSIKSSTAIIATAGVAVTKLVKNTVDYGDEIQTTADKYNLSAEAIQRWNYIALQSDVASEQLYKGMTKVRDAIGTALTGKTNTATEALQALGLNLNEIGTDDEAFKNIIQALSNVEDATLQAYYANEIFGERIATDLIPLLKGGTENLDQLNNEFNELGSLSNEEVKNLAELDNKFNNVTTKVQNLVYQLGSALSPIIISLIDLLQPFIDILQVILDLITPIIEGIAWLVDKVNTLGLATIGYGWLWGGEESKDKLNNVFNPSSNSDSYNETTNNYTTPTTSNNNNVSNYEDNSTTNVDINLNASGDLEYDAKTLADEVIRQIALKKQASGR